ncbi:NAD-dependent epimerase/dehydratase family protein [Primorskyibacter sp. S187A]|uniref:NAD-dependent epimerase/dehydratase family protein n=1 Tax=Primorskyibacter sp. S187A TaxID=3415130 RepID=UPI003C7AE87E
MTRKALILGSSGRFGGAMTDALWQAGWEVHLFQRGRDDLEQAAQGMDVIVNAWNPPYDRWAAELPEQTRAVIAAAQASGARVLFPGNLYVYGPDAPSVLRASTPHAATNPLGRLRIEIEEMYRAAGIKLLILRAGDYIDLGDTGNWYDRVITKPLRKGRISYPGALDAPHAWAFLPDLTRAGVALLDRDLPDQHEVLYPGYTLSGAQMALALCLATDRRITARTMAWGPLRLAQVFMPFIKGMFEMRYLWSKPHSIDPKDFAADLPDFRPTTPVDALAQTSAVRGLADAHPPRPDRGSQAAPPRSPARAT